MERTGTTVLVVNDDLFFGGRILSVLEKSGFRTATADSAAEAVESVSELRPDLVLVNLNSPRLDGMGVVRDVRLAAPKVLILAFLSHTLIPPVRNEVLAAGADQIVANSAVSMRLPAIVEALLSGQQLNSTDDH